MRSEFLGYYPPTEAEYKQLWASGTIVFDTNVLLDLYRLPAVARKEFLDLLNLLNERIWIPHHVALEFQLRRLTVISSERNTFDKTLRDAEKLYDDLKGSIQKLEIDRRDLGIDPKPLLDDFENSKNKLTEALKKAQNSQLEISSTDPIRDEIDKVLSERVGPAPADQDALDALTLNGDSRYSNRVPPGYMDADKEKNPEEATFIFDGKNYNRKFGDLIIWRQILNYARENELESLLLVTSDRKEDWWWISKGKSMGPRPELSREIHSVSGVRNFWMYTADQFLQNAPTFTKAKITEDSVSELRQISRVSALDGLAPRRDAERNALAHFARYSPQRNALTGRTTKAEFDDSLRIEEIENSVYNYLVRRFGDVEPCRGFPDFLVTEDGEKHGFEVKFIRNFERMLFPPAAIHTLLRGYLEVNEGNLDHFSLIAIIPYNNLEDIMSDDRYSVLSDRMDSILTKYPVTSIILGAYDPLLGLSIAEEYTSGK